MKNLKRTALVSTALLSLNGLAYADSACSGFILKLKNSLPHDFLINNIDVTNAHLQPAHLEALKSHTEQVLAVNDALKSQSVQGEISLHSISLPVKTLKIKFLLEDKVAYCHHEVTETQGEYSLYQTRVPGGVNYTING